MWYGNWESAYDVMAARSRGKPCNPAGLTFSLPLQQVDAASSLPFSLFFFFLVSFFCSPAADGNTATRCSRRPRWNMSATARLAACLALVLACAHGAHAAPGTVLQARVRGRGGSLAQIKFKSMALSLRRWDGLSSARASANGAQRLASVASVACFFVPLFGSFFLFVAAALRCIRQRLSGNGRLVLLFPCGHDLVMRREKGVKKKKEKEMKKKRRKRKRKRKEKVNV